MALLRPFGALGAIDETHSRTLWRSVRDAAPFCGERPVGDRPLWRVSTTPARGAEFAAKLPPGAQWFYDWAGGLIWIALPPSARRRRGNDPPRRGGDRRPRHARSARSAATRAAVDVFEPQQGALAARDQARQGELRSQGRAQPRPHVGGGVMQTNFSLAQLADPDIAVADKILRACVHCGFCTATCPTYVLLGDELDSPRGRIYLIKEMLEHDRAGDRRGGHAHRPLPVVPRLHDDLPLGRALHASGRSRPRAYRGDLPAAAARPADARCSSPT